MDIKKERLEYLFKSLVENTISREELDELAAYVHGAEDDKILQSSMKNLWNNLSPGDDNISSEHIYKNIVSDSRFQKAGKKKIISLPAHRTFLRYAAVLLITFGFGVWFYLNQTEDKTKTEIKQTASVRPVINPNDKTVVLTLADGSQIVLDKASDGTLAMQGDSRIEHTEGEIIYKNAEGLGLPDKETKQNTVTTPRGSDFRIVLPDGTKVWLNTMSAITYPVAFNGAERKIKITGEAYFEVARNPHKPFIVEANGTEVRVLGTHFNVKAYADENSVKTTLVEGSVQITNKEKSVVLKPGQQSTAALSGEAIKIATVDTDEILAWKNGYFLFNNENITTVMKTIARWYDIKVEYEGNIENKTFGGTIARFEDVEQLLKAMEITGAIQFKIMPAVSGKERRVVVMP